MGTCECEYNNCCTMHNYQDVGSVVFFTNTTELQTY